MKKLWHKFKIYFLIVALICFSLGLGARPTFAATAFNSKNAMQIVTASATVNDSTNMAVKAGGTNTVAFACIAYDASTGEAVSSATWGGVAMTSAGAAAFNSGAGKDYAEIWYIKNPTTGTSTLAITISGPTPADIYYNLVSFNNVNQTTPVRASTYGTATGVATSGTLVVSSNTNDLTMTCTNSGGSSFGATPTNQTNDSTNIGGGEAGGSDHATTAASSVTHTWTYAGSSNFAIAGFSIDGDPNTAAAVATSTTGTMTTMGGTMALMGGTLSK